MEKRKPKVAPQSQRGGSRRNYTTEKEKKKTHSYLVRVVLYHSRSGKITQNAPGPDGGGRQDEKKRRNHPKPGPKLRKRVLDHHRAARLPRPAPTLSGAGRQDKTRRNTPNAPQENQKTPEPINTKNPDLENPKTEKYRAQRRCENQLSTPAPRYSSTLRWIPRANVLVKCTCGQLTSRTALVEVA